MPSVPSTYTGVPEVAPQDQGISGPRVDAPAEAFGTGIAQAASGLGQSIEGAGDTLFKRAYAIQQVNNETEAREADTQYMIAAGQLHADYNALKGKQAVDAFPKYQKDLADVRGKIRDGMTNPMSAKMFDAQSLSTMGRSIFNGAGYMATENKNYQNGVIEARHKAYIDQVLSNPDDAPLFAGALESAKSDAIVQAGIHGYGINDDATKLLIKQKQSEVWSSKIDGLSYKNPKAAKDLMEGALKKGFILGQDYEKLSPKVDTQLHNIVSRNVSDAVNQGWAPYVTQDQAARSGGVEVSLVDTLKRAQQNHPELRFGIGGQGGKRTQEEQDDLYSQGRTRPGQVVTWTRSSKHIEGTALDVVPYDPGTNDAQVKAAMIEAADQLGVKINYPTNLAGKDPNHVQLADDFDRASYKSPEPPDLATRQKVAGTYVNDTYGDQKMNYATRDRVDSDWRKQQADDRHEQAQTYNQLANFALENKIINKDMMLNQPTLSEAYFKLDPAHKNRVDNLIKANARQESAETPERAQATQRILNMSTEMSGKRAAFLNIDPAELQEQGIVSTSGMKAIYAKQRQINEGQANDSRKLQHAISISRSYLKATNITAGSDEEAQFIGRMNTWLTEYEKEKKAYPSDEDTRKKADELTTYEPWMGFLPIGGKYELTPPSDFVKEFTPLFKARPNNPGKKDPSVSDIAKAYEYSIKHPNWREELQ